MSDRLFPVVFLATLCILQGCSSQVAMTDPHIPDPLIAQMPLSVGIRFPAAFDNFVHEERVIGKETWEIDLGKSNKLLFTKLFGAMFSKIQVVSADSDIAALGIDAVIEPSIDAFEFSVPEQSQTDAFAVWIRYRIKIFDSAGTQVANWPISAYGKSQTSTFGGDEALQRAAVLAMRDAAALVILQMDKATGISQLGKRNTPESELNSDEPSITPTALQTITTEEIPDEAG